MTFFPFPPTQFLRRRAALSLTAVFLTLGFLTMPGFAQTSSAYIIVDRHTRRILDGQNIDEKLPVASLTKVVTACVVLDWLDATESDRNRYITVPPSAATMGGANPLGMQPGDQITIRDALFCALMASDNVAAQTLAEYVGQEMLRARSGRAASGVDFFVTQMNALAAAQNMTDSKFVNPHGLDHEKPRGHSTAADMARIMIYALNKPSFNFAVHQTEREVAYLRGQQKYAFRIHNTNKLLGQFDVEGGKTGRTSRAGDCLITAVHRPDRIQELGDGRRLRTPYHLVIVTLGSTDRFGQTVQLIQRGWALYEQFLAGGLRSTEGQVLQMPPDPSEQG